MSDTLLFDKIFAPVVSEFVQKLVTYLAEKGIHEDEKELVNMFFTNLTENKKARKKKQDIPEEPFIHPLAELTEEQKEDCKQFYRECRETEEGRLQFVDELTNVYNRVMEEGEDSRPLIQRYEIPLLPLQLIEQLNDGDLQLCLEAWDEYTIWTYEKIVAESCFEDEMQIALENLFSKELEAGQVSIGPSFIKLEVTPRVLEEHKVYIEECEKLRETQLVRRIRDVAKQSGRTIFKFKRSKEEMIQQLVMFKVNPTLACFEDTFATFPLATKYKASLFNSSKNNKKWSTGCFKHIAKQFDITSYLELKRQTKTAIQKLREEVPTY